MVQLRQDDLAAEHYSLVGFQTQMKWGEQQRVLRMIPGLESAEFVRYGMIHRNTYINAPSVLGPSWQVRGRPGVFLRRSDLRCRRLCGVGRVGSARRAWSRGAFTRAHGPVPPTDDCPRGHRTLRVTREPSQLPADEHRVRSFAIFGHTAP